MTTYQGFELDLEAKKVQDRHGYKYLAKVTSIKKRSKASQCEIMKKFHCMNSLSIKQLEGKIR